MAEFRVRWYESQQERERIGAEMAKDYARRNGAPYGVTFHPANELTCLKRRTRAEKKLTAELKRGGFVLSASEPHPDGGEWMIYRTKEARDDGEAGR